MYTDNDYKKIFDLVKHDELIGYHKYQRLVPYNNLLKVMFEPWHNVNGSDEHAKDCITLLKKIPDPLKNIDENMIKLCNSKGRISMHDYLECIFRPKEVIEDGRYTGYFIRTFMNLMHDYIVNNNSMVFTYTKLTDYCSFYDEITENDDFWHYHDICVTLLTYGYANDGNYEILKEFLSDPEYFNDILKMNRIDFRYAKSWTSTDIMYERLYKKGDFLLSKNKLPIK